jgi:4-hydroxy-tetrahydrodipicolinate reductase
LISQSSGANRSANGVVRTLIIGATGRMGQALVRAALEHPHVRISGAVASVGSDQLGRDVGDIAGVGKFGISVTSDLTSALGQADVAIDFSKPSATAANLAACVGAGKPLLIGTTGVPENLTNDFERASRHIPLLVAPNTSVGVTLLMELVRNSARALSLDYDVEIVEAHHRMKRDAPSGTALALGQAVADERGQQLENVATTNRNGEAPRRKGDIGFAVVRGGDIVGEHTVIFAGTGEQLILGHKASDRSIFARGALDAAAWLARRPAGRYAMRDVISLKTGG